MKGSMLLTVLAAALCLAGSCLTKDADKQSGGSGSAAAAADTRVIETRVVGRQTADVRTVIQGTVRIYGSEPHTFVGIAADGKAYAVYPPEKEAELRELQGRLMRFTVRFIEPPQTYGSLFLQDGCVEIVSMQPLADQGAGASVEYYDLGE